MKWLILFVVLLSLFLIAGCNTKTGAVVVDNTKWSENNDAVRDTEVKDKIILDCDDQNVCTDDKFNTQTKKCDFITKKPCCGNNICEDNEGCNTVTYKTACEKDCGLRCESKLEVSGILCEGSCSISRNGDIVIGGPSKIKFELMNLGEKQTGDLVTDVNCTKKSGGTSFKNYFDGGKDMANLKSREKISYYLEFSGPDTFTMECNVNFKSDYSFSFNRLNIVGR